MLVRIRGNSYTSTRRLAETARMRYGAGSIGCARLFLLVVGSNFYYETPIAIQWGQMPVVWVNRDEDGYLLLNVNMLTASEGGERTRWTNFWLGIGEPDDLECPP